MSRLLADRMAEGGGVLCNDQNGLCLGFRGDIDASRSGIYTSIAKLASQLDSTVDGSGGGDNSHDVPLISIQTEKSTLLVKEYGERTVVYNPSAQHINWKANCAMHNCSSLIGPNICKNALSRVMFTISFSPITTFDGSIKPVMALNFGSRCLGQGTNLNSCGVDQRKLITWGIKNKSNVLLK